jgi:hypothetical protein
MRDRPPALRDGAGLCGGRGEPTEELPARRLVFVTARDDVAARLGEPPELATMLRATVTAR